MQLRRTKEIIELNMEEFTSSKKLRQKLVGIGNYTWLADDSSQIQLMRYLAKVSETAVEIKQLGWQQQGFYCFCNGALEDGVWHPVDDKGIVRLEKRNYYLPAMSQIYKDSTELYSNERKFRHQTYSNISLHDYFSKIVDVFGDNAVISLSSIWLRSSRMSISRSPLLSLSSTSLAQRVLVRPNWLRQ